MSKAKTATQEQKPLPPFPVVPLRPVIVCTEQKGVFFGYAFNTRGKDVDLFRARMACRWGVEKGVMELAETGPTSESIISARADLEVRDVILVMEVTETALRAWEEAP